MVQGTVLHLLEVEILYYRLNTVFCCTTALLERIG